MFSVSLLFEIFYTFDAIINIIIVTFFAELGRLCRYESSSVSIRNVRWWRGFDLLVWNSADTTRKTKWILVIVAEIHGIYVHNVYAALKQLRNYGPINYWADFPYTTFWNKFFGIIWKCGLKFIIY